MGATFGGGPNLIVRRLDAAAIAAWRSGANVVAFATDEGTIPAPFWRECIHETTDERSWLEPFAANRWSEIGALACDRTLDEAFWSAAIGDSGVAPLRRIDTRTYAATPYVLEFQSDRSALIVTTLRPYGGLGTVPYGFKNNAAGAVALARLLQRLESAP